MAVLIPDVPTSNVSVRRQALGITSAKFAEMCLLSVWRFYRYEKNVGSVTAEEQARIELVLTLLEASYASAYHAARQSIVRAGSPQRQRREAVLV